MNRRTADTVVGVAIALVLVVGLAATWQAWQSTRQSRRTAQQTPGGMMGGSMMSTGMMDTGPDPIWILLGTVAIAALVGVLYVVTRESVRREGDGAERRPAASQRRDPNAATREPIGEPTGERTWERTAEPGEPDAGTGGAATAERDAGNEAASTPKSRRSSGGTGRPALLDVLPEDERRILEPVVESPGLTQIELRDRADFSKSKVSQTVSDLEKRGLLSRERQGRTYRVYPAGELAEE